MVTNGDEILMQPGDTLTIILPSGLRLKTEYIQDKLQVVVQGDRVIVATVTHGSLTFRRLNDHN